MAFLLTLALRLGKTLQEICNQLSADELFLWQAYDRKSPLSDQRADVLAAITAAASFQAQGAKVTALDLLPTWTAEPQEVDELGDGEEMLRKFLSDRADLQS